MPTITYTVGEIEIDVRDVCEAIAESYPTTMRDVLEEHGELIDDDVWPAFLNDKSTDDLAEFLNDKTDHDAAELAAALLGRAEPDHETMARAVIATGIEPMALLKALRGSESAEVEDALRGADLLGSERVIISRALRLYATVNDAVDRDAEAEVARGIAEKVLR